MNSEKDEFKTRIKQLEEKLNLHEKTLCFNELDYTITESEIVKAISKIKLNKSPGLDNITNNMIKNSQTTLLQCFMKTFNACLSNGTYPAQWSEGYITPLYKSKDMNDPNNYRGLTITSAIGKLFNRIMNTRLDNFLIKNKIIDDCQIGFTKKVQTSDHMFVLKTIIDKYCNNASGRVYMLC